MTKLRGHINPFFVEIIIILLFFSIAAAVTLNLFAHSRLCSEESARLTLSVSAAQTAAEGVLLRAGSGDIAQGSERLYFDDGGAVLEGEEGHAFVAEITIAATDSGLARCKISVSAAEGRGEPYVLEFDVSAPRLCAQDAGEALLC